MKTITDNNESEFQNRCLGDYNMVVALSKSSIDFLFKMMMKVGSARDTWSIRVTYDTFQDPQEIFINESKSDYERAFEAGKGKIFMQGFYTTLRQFTVQMIESDNQSVIFQIHFKNGDMSIMAATGSIKNINLDGMIYAFQVDLNKMAKPYEEAIQDLDTEVVQNIDSVIAQVDEEGIKPEDFTIQSLFLNFENADIVNYSKHYTSFPEDLSGKDIGHLTSFQTLLTNYYNSDLRDTPFILGYCVTLPTLKPIKGAVFQPKTLNYSTSYSEDPNRAAINYMMMIDDTVVKDNIIIDPLIREKMGSEMNGVLALNNDLFFERYLKLFFEQITTAFKESINDLKGEQNSKSHTALAGFTGADTITIKESQFEVTRLDASRIELGHGKVNLQHTQKTKFSDDRGPHYSTSVTSKNIELSPKATLSIQEVEVSKNITESYLEIYLKLEQTVVYSVPYASNPATKSNTKQKQPDGVIFSIKPSQGGKFSCSYKKVEHKKLDLIDGSQGTIDYVDDTITGEFYSNINSDKFLNSLLKRLTVGLNSLPQIILPISNIYAYNSINFIGSKRGDAITFDAAYIASLS